MQIHVVKSRFPLSYPVSLNPQLYDLFVANVLARHPHFNTLACSWYLRHLSSRNRKSSRPSSTQGASQEVAQAAANADGPKAKMAQSVSIPP
jgi:hypothetical protein